MRKFLILILLAVCVGAKAQFVSNFQIIRDIDKTYEVTANSLVSINFLGSVVLTRIGDVEYRDAVVRSSLYKTDGKNSTYRVSVQDGVYMFETVNNQIIRVEWRPYNGLITIFERLKA